MRKTFKWLGATAAVAGALVLGITQAAVAAPAETTRVNATGHAIPPLHVPIKREAAPAPAALIAPMALPGAARWQERQEAIFDRRALILPPGSTLSYADAASLLGVSSVADSSWGNGGVGPRAMFNGSGWSGGAGAFAVISNSGRYGQLYVLWQ